MLVVADTHVHFYPVFDLTLAFGSLMDALEAAAGGVEHVKVACLTEREDCNWFRQVLSGETVLPDGFEVSAGDDDASLIVTDPAGRNLYVIAGRQYATAERIEVVSVGTDDRLEPGLSAAELVKQIGAGRGIPVLSWSFGKWLFKRAAVVADVIESCDPGLIIGDISLRPSGLPEPRGFRAARDRGFRVIAGSDALPCAGEERQLGGYCTVFEGEFDVAGPTESMRKMLTGSGEIRFAGKRAGLVGASLRVLRNMLV